MSRHLYLLPLVLLIGLQSTYCLGIAESEAQQTHSLALSIGEECLNCCGNPEYFGGSRFCDPVHIVTESSIQIVPQVKAIQSTISVATKEETISIAKTNSAYHSRPSISMPMQKCYLEEKQRTLLESIQVCVGNASFYQLALPIVEKPSRFPLIPFLPVQLGRPTVYSPLVELQDNIFEAVQPTRSRMGEVKSVKNRINLASTKAGAVILDKSKGMTGADAVLTDSKYKYSLSECTKEKWFLFSLAEMVVVDAIATANLERFSSSVKEFVVYGSQIYPTRSWSFLGYFQADDNSEIQVFPVTAPTWTKYVRVMWLNWHQTETICTMTEFRVYGSNMMSAMLNTDFAKSPASTAGLKDIITDVDEEQTEQQSAAVVTVEREVQSKVSESTSSVPLSISPEFQPLYELYVQCTQQQEDLSFSVALLYNRTKSKIRMIKERVTVLEQGYQSLQHQLRMQDIFLQTLNDAVKTAEKRVQSTDESLQYAQTWMVMLIVLIGGYSLYKAVKMTLNNLLEADEMRAMRKEMEGLKRQIQTVALLCVKKEEEDMGMALSPREVHVRKRRSLRKMKST